MSSRTHLLAAAMLLVTALTVSAQPATFRLKGKVVTATGAPIAGARIRTDAIAGVQGLDFVGERNFTATANAKGEWAILGITRGAWIFEASAPGYAPRVVAVPVNMTHSGPSRPVTWLLTLVLLSLDDLRDSGGEGAALADDLLLMTATDRPPTKSDGVRLLDRARSLRLEGVALCAAGDLALLAREPATARAIFRKAESEASTDPCGPLGVASASLFLFDVDAAVASYDRARKTTSDKSLQQVMSAALADLRNVAMAR